MSLLNHIAVKRPEALLQEIVGVLAISLVGPGFLTAISTGMPTTAQLRLIQSPNASAQPLPAVLAAQR